MSETVEVEVTVTFKYEMRPDNYSPEDDTLEKRMAYDQQVFEEDPGQIAECLSIYDYTARVLEAVK